MTIDEALAKLNLLKEKGIKGSTQLYVDLESFKVLSSGIEIHFEIDANMDLVIKGELN